MSCSIHPLKPNLKHTGMCLFISWQQLMSCCNYPTLSQMGYGFSWVEKKVEYPVSPTQSAVMCVYVSPQNGKYICHPLNFQQLFMVLFHFQSKEWFFLTTRWDPKFEICRWMLFIDWSECCIGMCPEIIF